MSYLYLDFDTIISWYFFDDLSKQNKATSRKGTVGITGRKAPTIPKPVAKSPTYI